MNKIWKNLVLLFIFLSALFFYRTYFKPSSPYLITGVKDKTETQKINLDEPSVTSVVRVVDGDTIVVLMNNVMEKVRLIGINTPETVDPRKIVECFGKEASAKTKELLFEKEVILKKDLTQNNRDKYGRLLRYVYLPDGTFVNLVLIKEGYAYEYTYKVPYEFQTEFKKAQAVAEKEKKGLWADGVCNAKNI